MSDTLTTLAAAPLLPWPFIAALATLALGVIGIGLARRARGVWWRALGLAAVVLALINPAVIEESREARSDIAVLVVDRSPSQKVGQRQARIEAAVAAVKSRVAAIPNLDLRVVTVDAGQRGADLPPASGTELFAPLKRALADIPRRRLAGVMMITDGQVHDIPADAKARRRLGLKAPLHVLLTGRRDERDRRLIVEQAPRFAIVGQPLTLKLRVEDEGNAAGRDRLAKVTMRRVGAPDQTMLVPIGESRAVTLALDRAGPTAIELAVEDGPAELSRINNRAVVEINGVRDRLRVLLVSGEAHAGERVWRNLLKADPSVDLVHFTILRPPEKQDATPIRELALISFPIRELFETKLKDFDLIIFDRYRRRGVVPMTYVGNITRYVEEGGALLTASGPAFAGPLSLYRTPLNLVLPAQPTGEIFKSGYRARLTDKGRRHPVTANLPGAGDAKTPPSWGRWFRQIDADVDRGTVLMSGVAGRPILVLDRVGKGRVAQLLTDHMWLWARGFEGGGPQAEVLRRLSHWLMKEPDLEEESLRASARGDRLEIVRRSLGDKVPPVTVTEPSGETRTVRLEAMGDGRSIATIAVDEPGLYRLDDGVRRAVAAVGEINPREFADLRATEAGLAPLVAETGGGIAWLADGGVPTLRMVAPGRDAAGRGWLGLRANGDHVVTGIRQAPLLPAWAALALALGGLMLAWRAEGR